MGKYIGIDLGTTFSCMAYINEDGNPVVISNAEGENITASTVYYSEDGRTVVGDAAKEASLENPQNFVEHIKCFMGRGKFGENAVHTSDGRSFEPEDVSAVILKKLKTDAEKLLGDTIDGAVITVPAYFNDLQRDATQKAGEIAGLNVMGIINEPTAAALAFGASAESADKQTILVYDLGGGTFDVTVMEIDGNEITVLATDGDREKGGRNFDMLIIEDAYKQALSQGIDLKKDDDDWRDLTMKAEKCKRNLSQASQSSFIIKAAGGKKFSYTLTRDDFEKMLEQHIIQTISVVEGVCEDAGISYGDLDKILLVGGSTRIPMIARVLEDETGIKPSGEVHPDEAVAIGAAFYACELAHKFAENKPNNNGTNQPDIPELKKSFSFTDVTSHSIGLVAQDNDTGKLYNSIVLPRNEPVPAQFTNRYHTTQSFQSEIELQITQGEDKDIEYVPIIGTSVIQIAPRENPVTVEVTISCDKNSIIHVNVTDIDANTFLGEMEIDRTCNLTREQIEDSKHLIETLDISGDY